MVAEGTRESWFFAFVLARSLCAVGGICSCTSSLSAWDRSPLSLVWCVRKDLVPSPVVVSVICSLLEFFLVDFTVLILVGCSHAQVRVFILVPRWFTCNSGTNSGWSQVLDQLQEVSVLKSSARWFLNRVFLVYNGIITEVVFRSQVSTLSPVICFLILFLFFYGSLRFSNLVLSADSLWIATWY
jgi:hypothetical protein